MAIVINGSGTVTGISVGGLPDDIVDAGTLADDAVGLAQMAAGTDGNVITYDTSGNPAVVATGSSGQVLTSAGADAVPTFAAAGGGKILQVVHNVDTSRTSVDTSTSSPATVATSSAITPASSSNKIAISWASSLQKAAANDMEAYGYLYRDSTQVIRFGAYLNNNSTDYETGGASIFYVDSPGDTSAHTYYIKFARSTGSLVVNNGTDSMSIVLMEIEG